MKKVFPIVVLLLLTVSLQAQKSKAPAPYDVKMKVYQEALKYGDLVVARGAVYEMMALHPEEKNWRDTLAMLFYGSGMYMQTIILGKQLLDEKKDDQVMMELVAVSEEGIGMTKEALADYEKLFGLSGKLMHQYKIAALQYSLQRYGECTQTLTALLGKSEASAEKISLSIGQNQTQEVVLSAACWNVAGMVAIETNQLTEAKTYFEKALQLAPDFALPKNNIAYIESLNKKP